MVNPIIIRILVQVFSSLGKSVLTAYKQTASKQGNTKPNPLSEFIQQTMQSANLAHRPMFKSDAIKILNLENKEVTPETILKNFWPQFHKNDPIKGGSQYIQSMLFNAKNELMKDFPDVNENTVVEKLGLNKKQEEESNQGDEAKTNEKQK